jgi:hypothetical protein
MNRANRSRGQPRMNTDDDFILQAVVRVMMPLLTELGFNIFSFLQRFRAYGAGGGVRSCHYLSGFRPLIENILLSLSGTCECAV